MRRPATRTGPNASDDCCGQPLMQRAAGLNLHSSPMGPGPPVPGDTGRRASATCAVAEPSTGWRLTVTATDSTAEPPSAEAFYDARRDVYYTKPALRGWLHLLWFEVSLVFGTLLLARAHGATRITACAIYTASVSGMFGISALYHRGNWSATWRQRLQRLDHAMIFFLIAGTATPAFLLAARGTFG